MNEPRTAAWPAKIRAALDTARQRWWLQPGWRSIALAVALALVSSTMLMQAGWLLGPQTAVHDVESRLFAPGGVSQGVLLVDIDGPSLDELGLELGAWPPRRELLARVVDYLMDAGARAVAIDIVFADARHGDAALLLTLAARHGRVVLAAGALSTPGGPARPGTGGCPVMPWPSLLLPTAALGGAVPRQPVGMVSMPADDDGQLRALPLLHAAAGQLLPVLPLAALMASRDVDASALRCADGYAMLDGLHLPIDAAGRIWPALGRAADSVPLLPFATVARAATGNADDTALREQVQGRVVFIGASAAMAGEVQTPLGPRTGANLLAATFSALETGLLYRPPRPWLDRILLLLACVPALAAWRRGALRWPADGVWTVAALGALGALDGAAIALTLQRMQIAAPALALLVFALLSQIHCRHLMLASQRRVEHARDAAEAANRLKSEFLAHMSHELRTPMSALLGSAELLAATALDEHQRRYVNLFRSAGVDLMDMLNDLLDLSKIEAGLLTLHRRPFSLLEFVAGQAALFESNALRKRLQLLTRLDADLPVVVLGDPDRLAQVLRNLLSNALKFTRHGSVTLVVSRVAGADDRLRFEVIDTGIGIAADRLESIFMPFTQAEDGVGRAYGGTGLGLTIARRLVTLMSGAIGVESRLGEGTVFRVEIELPATDEAPPVDPSHTAPAAELGPRPALKILLADDNPHNVFLVEAYLEHDAHRIDVVHDGQAAIERFGQFSYDLVLMDIQMPGMDGYSATAALRAIEHSRGAAPVPVIALTANALPDDIDRSLAAGCSAHLSKPFSRVELRRMLARFCPQALGPTPSERAATVEPVGEGRIPVALSSLLGADLLLALARMGGQTALYLRVLDAAAPGLHGWSARFAAALESDDRVLAKRLVHDLKSVAGSIGALALSRAAQALEVDLNATLEAGPHPGAGRDGNDSHAAVEAALAPLLMALGVSARPDRGLDDAA